MFLNSLKTPTSGRGSLKIKKDEKKEEKPCQRLRFWRSNLCIYLITLHCSDGQNFRDDQCSRQLFGNDGIYFPSYWSRPIDNIGN